MIADRNGPLSSVPSGPVGVVESAYCRLCLHSIGFWARTPFRCGSGTPGYPLPWRARAEAPDPPTATPSRVAVDETAVTIGTERHWLYVTIDVETKLVLDV